MTLNLSFCTETPCSITFFLILQGASDWAIKTLNDHKKDKREWLYTRDEFDEAKTHDELWNSAQIQLR